MMLKGSGFVLERKRSNGRREEYVTERTIKEIEGNTLARRNTEWRRREKENKQ